MPLVGAEGVLRPQPKPIELTTSCLRKTEWVVGVWGMTRVFIHVYSNGKLHKRRINHGIIPTRQCTFIQGWLVSCCLLAEDLFWGDNAPSCWKVILSCVPVSHRQQQIYKLTTAALRWPSTTPGLMFPMPAAMTLNYNEAVQLQLFVS